MRYTISAHNFGDVSVPRATAIEAAAKAVDMIGAGITDVQITDTQTGRIYRDDEWHLLDPGQAKKERAAEIKSAALASSKE
jgi:hypothetical protein